MYVPFGEAKEFHNEEKDDVIRIYFDRMGFIYPDIPIKSEEFTRNDGRLNQLYANNLNLYGNACEVENTIPSDSNLNTIPPYEDPLQTALIQKYIKKINVASDNKELVFIIHGFNEYPLNARDSSSFEEMKQTRHVLERQTSEKELHFIEIYWDGLTQEGGAEFLRPINSFKIWNNSQVSATHVGMELRRVLSKITKDNIYVITHSHGAGVITTALFNVIKFRPNLYTNEGSWLNELNMKYNNELYDTPKQKIVTGMLTPAIPGVNVFEEYYHRTISGKNVLSSETNLKFIVGFNEHDPVTRKFKVAAKKLGSTSLASIGNELLRTENLFNDRNIIDHVDFSTLSNGLPMNDHSWFTYLRNTNSMNRFITKLFN
ncbi:hypothetical protein [Algoriphagus aquimarinus]|uniref:hypothetical protein n=1 Tax=Algoriphagus aquimarinus TaxID=237018 RepID=UPI0030D778FF|tara:strand:+ start:8364 stop:9485 length:1122 start_codon:yes stop_codon:yes gene_type:complete